MDPSAEITIIEKEEILSYAGCGLPYWISGLVEDRNTLISTPVGVLRDPQFFAKAKNIKVLNRTEAQEINREEKEVLCKDLETGKTFPVQYDKLVIATGSRPFDLPIPGAKLKKVLHLKDPDDAAQLRDAISVSCRKVVIVGGGLIGCEMTEAVSECGKQVTIIEMLSHILPGMLDEGLVSGLE